MATVLDRAYLTMCAVYEQIEGMPGLGELAGKVAESIRDLTSMTELGTLDVEPCGDPDCVLGPYCFAEEA